MLPVLVPGGRLPRDFPARCLKAARARREISRIERAALGAGAAIVGEDGRPQAGGGPRGAPPSAPLSSRARRRLGRLAARYPGNPEEGLAPGELAIPGTRWLVDRRGALRERTVVPGSEIIVGPPLRSHRVRLRAVRDPRGAAHAARRLGRALGLLDAAWPEAGEEVRRWTRLVLPLAEPGLVSFSLPARPGVSFINLRGKSLVDLADDLLHETAHHRLHAIERRGSLVSRMAANESAPRFWSPWRRALRPARGILHAVYTFSFRAELLSRMAKLAKRDTGDARTRASIRAASLAPGALASEARREKSRLRRSLDDLKRAAHTGLLTPAGRRLLAPLRAASRPARG